ncbi:MAG: hypothetical protein NPIRA04_03660 [Nitrospirales bacterium]|nr:MAG: hypothetical protein NPIRA04_03660 [Nitrospirales bacterium]
MGSVSFVVFIVLLLTGCTSAPIFSRLVYQDPILNVRLHSPLYKSKEHRATNSHPITFTVEDLQSILQSLNIQREVSFLNYYVFRQDAIPQPVFPPDISKLLAPQIKTAFAKAQSEEIVVFVMNRPREDGVPVITSGGLFVKGEQLTFVLTHVETPMTSERKRKQVQENPLTPLNDPDFHFVAGPSQTILTPTATSEFLPGRPSAPTVSIHYNALLTHVPDPVLPLNADSDPLPSSPAFTSEEKLRQLKSWHQQGLISEPEYRKKREEILEAFQ